MKRKTKLILIALLSGIVISLLSFYTKIQLQESVETIQSTPSPTMIASTATPRTMSTNTAAPTMTATELPLVCVSSILPSNSSTTPSIGKTSFSWTSMDQADSYILVILLPSGSSVPFETSQTSYELYMESFSAGGEYQWYVVALDNQGNEICAGEIFTFEKTYYQQDDGDQPGDDEKIENTGSGVTGGEEGGDTHE